MLYWTFSLPNLFEIQEIISMNVNSMKLILLASTVIITLSLFVNFGIRVLKSNFLIFFQTFQLLVMQYQEL